MKVQYVAVTVGLAGAVMAGSIGYVRAQEVFEAPGDPRLGQESAPVPGDTNGLSPGLRQDNRLGNALFDNLWWILPALAIPLIIYALTRREELYETSGSLAVSGIKGGQARQRRRNSRRRDRKKGRRSDELRSR